MSSCVVPKLAPMDIPVTGVMRGSVATAWEVITEILWFLLPLSSLLALLPTMGSRASLAHISDSLAAGFLDTS